MSKAGKLLPLAICFGASLLAQEAGGQAELGFQQYYLSMGSQRVANISGLAVSLSEVIPDIGLLSASLAPALDNAHFRTGDDFLRLKGLPWRGQYWSFGVGDFYLPGQMLATPFTNLYIPQIAGRGITVEASHGGRTIGLFYGSGTIANSPRVVLRVGVPQTLRGLYVQQKVGSRLLLAARYVQLANNLEALRNTPYLTVQANPFQAARSVNLSAVYRIAKPLKWYSEVAWSASDQPIGMGARNLPFSTVIGPTLDTKPFTLRANYTFQNASYLPLLGYYLGDRQGPFAEVRIRPLRRFELYGSGGQYQNNVARDPKLQSFRSTSESLGVSFELPARVYINGQVTLLDLSSRRDAASLWSRSKNQQQTATLSRSFARHNLRLTARDFRLNSQISPQRQRSAEIEDILRIKRLVLGGGARIQRSSVSESRTTLYYRAVAQVQIKRVSAYANIESGNDMQNRTLFATNTISTTIFGASVAITRDWDVQAEAYRNNLITDLNPQSIFVLQGQGVAVPGTLAALNQWSLYFRISRKFRWGKAGTAADLTQYATDRAALKGVVEGVVSEHAAGADQPVEGIAVRLDGSRTATSDAQGRFHFSEVPEGSHRVGLATDELLAEFDPGPKKETLVAVFANKLARADLNVIRLASLEGKITGPAGAPLENIVIKIVGTDRYTTPDGEGHFYFYNLRQGEYELCVDEKTLPEYGRLMKPAAVKVSIGTAALPQPIGFRFEVHKPEKAVRKVFEKN